MDSLKDFTNLYPVSKTLRFELKPVGKTLENIEKAGILKEDEHRAESYRRVKKIIDTYHKVFIDSSLENMAKMGIENEIKAMLQSFCELYKKDHRTEGEDKALDKIRAILRGLIVGAFTGVCGRRENTVQNEKYESLFKEKLIKEILPDFVLSTEAESLPFSVEEATRSLKEFDSFTSYFAGFYENRKNIYSTKPQSTAIAYRLIHENLPKFIDNILVFQKIKEPIAKELEHIRADFSAGGYIKKDERLEDIFSLNYYIHVLSQAGIEKYNALIGKIVTEGDGEMKGLNEHINLYNQQRGREDRLPLFRPLYKQILSDREQLSYLPESFEKDEELLRALKEFYDHIAEDILGRTQQLMTSISEYDLSRIYVRNDSQLTDISKKMLGDWNAIYMARERAYDHEQAPKRITAKYERDRIKALKGEESISLANLNSCIAFLDNVRDCRVDTYLSTLGQKEGPHGLSNLVENVFASYHEAEQLLSFPYPEENNLIQDKDNVVLIKNLLDNISDLQRFLKPLWGMGDEPDKDERFYGEYNYIRGALDQVIPLYNKVRNYLTRKPYSTRKVKLNFGNSQLLSGWDRNKEKDNSCVILRKGQNFYLAIMNNRHKRSFENKVLPEYKEGEPYFEKMDYKFLPDPNKMLPKVFLSKKGIEIYKPSPKLLEQYGHGTHKKGDTFSMDDLHELIDFFKHSIEAHEDWKQFGFKFSDTATYENVSSFYREVEDQGYKLSFRKVSESYVYSLIDQGKLYLFQIYNKDFSPCSKGTPNLHTLYWRMLFDERNLADVIYKLDGKAEIFFREKSLKNDHPTHPAGKPIKKKSRQKKGEESLFEYDLVKDRRYTMDKFQFHVPITMNFKCSAGSKVNDMVNAHIREAKDMHVIGIDRGERNLLYICVIDSRGTILDQISLNTINDIDYHDLLESRDKDRQQERRNWQTIEGIKELKQGYLSQAVHRIAELMVAYKAVVALEDLNMGFKRGRQKVESSVYQQFEKQLIDKLNYLVDKKKRPEDIGGLLRAYQFTAPFKSFKEMGKQNGFLFYIPAWNTSNIDPTTGFVNLFHVQYENVDKAKSFFQKFDSISYNPKKDWFEFAFDYKNFTKKAEGSCSMWILCTHGSRIKNFRNSQKNGQWDSEEFALTEAFKSLFVRYEIDYTADLKTAIVDEKQKDFFVDLLKLFKLTVQMRNSWKEKDLDYLISPVAGADGRFFDTREGNKSLPKDADANGAYNIALKGLWALRQIRQTSEGGKLKLAISNKEWLQFVQERSYEKD